MLCRFHTAEITKLLFGESRRHIIPVGKTFTVEDVQAQQPDTEDFLDVKNLAPGMFATPPATCSHLQPLEQPLADICSRASGYKWLLKVAQVAFQVAASGCFCQIQNAHHTHAR